MNYLADANKLQRKFCSSKDTDRDTDFTEANWDHESPRSSSFLRNPSISTVSSSSSADLLKVRLGKVNLPGPKLGRIRSNDMFGALAKLGRQFRNHELLHYPLADSEQFFRDFRQFVLQANLVSISEFDTLSRDNNDEFKKQCRCWLEFVKYHFYGWYKFLQSNSKFMFDSMRGLSFNSNVNQFLNPVLDQPNNSIFSVIQM